MRALRSHTELPPIVSGYALDNVDISFYQPQSGVNLWTNPSAERATTGYTAVGGSVAQSGDYQRWGAYSLEVTPSASLTSGVYAGTVDLASGQLYFASVFGYFAAGAPYQIYFANTSGTLLGTAYTFRGRGRWERVWVSYVETSTASRRIYITKNGSANITPFYLDGLQVEVDRLTSYIDGDQRGFIKSQQAYYWTGTPHASTSIRVQATRSGGIEVKLADYGFTVLALVGLGLSGFTNIATPNVYVGGAQYERTSYTERTFDIVGVFQAETFGRLQQLRHELANVLRPSVGIITQPMVLRLQTLDECGRARGEPIEVVCVLEPSSLAGNWNNNYAEGVSLTFTTYLPYMAAMEGEAGGVLTYQDVADLAWLFSRDASGIWTEIQGLNGEVYAILPLDNNRILVGGNFTNAGAVADADYLAIYTYSTGAWTALNATPLNAVVRALAILPDGDTVLVGGSFINAITADGDRLIYLTLSTGAYSVINATPLASGQVNSIKVLQNGDALVGGTFLNAGGADGDFIFKLVGTVYTPLNATPLSATTVRDIAVLPNGNAVIIGDFVNAGGDAFADRIAYITISSGAFSQLNASSLYITTPQTLAVGLDGKLYIGGANSLGSWSGIDLPYVGLTSLNNDIDDILALPDGTIAMTGQFTGVVGGISTYGMAVWNGSTVVFSDVYFSGSSFGNALAYTPDGKFLVGMQISSNSGPTAFVNTLVNNGTADAFPTFEFVGPGEVYQLKNYTTGDVLYFNLTLNDGERATLTLGPGNISFTSTFRGNILKTILPGSSLATFRLTPGLNSVSAFIAGTTDSDTALTAHWKVCYLSADDALYQ